MITKIGKQKLEERLIALRQELVRTSDERGRAAAEGDLSENSAYIFLGERAEVLRSQIGEITADLKVSEVQSVPTQNHTISFGHQITIIFEDDQRQMTITLVGKNDAHLQPDWISTESPLGIALMGKGSSDIVDVNGQPVKIISISAGNI